MTVVCGWGGGKEGGYSAAVWAFPGVFSPAARLYKSRLVAPPALFHRTIGVEPMLFIPSGD